MSLTLCCRQLTENFPDLDCGLLLLPSGPGKWKNIFNCAFAVVEENLAYMAAPANIVRPGRRRSKPVLTK